MVDCSMKRYCAMPIKALLLAFFINNKAQVKRKPLVIQLILCDVTPTSAE